MIELRIVLAIDEKGICIVVHHQIYIIQGGKKGRFVPKINRTKKSPSSNEHVELRITLVIDHIEKKKNIAPNLHHSRCQKIEGYSTLEITRTKKRISPAEC